MEFVENLKKDSLHLQSFFDFFDTLHLRIPYSLFIIIRLSSKDIYIYNYIYYFIVILDDNIIIIIIIIVISIIHLYPILLLYYL